MELLLENKTEFNFNEKFINIVEKCILKTLETEDFSKNVEVSFLVVYNNEIKKLNCLYRNINKETDVLSFPLLEFPLKESLNKNVITPIGDIIISIEKAISQAEEYGHSIEREIAFLTVHSMLHLLGYDHMEENEEKIMFQKQDKILNLLEFFR